MKLKLFHAYCSGIVTRRQQYEEQDEHTSYVDA